MPSLDVFVKTYAMCLICYALKIHDLFQRAKSLKQMKEDGNAAFKSSDWSKAHDLYSQALQIDPCNKATNAKLYFNRATVAAKLKKFQDSVSDCNEALKLDDKYLKALVRRGRSYMELEKYEEAVRDFEQVNKMERNNGEYRQLLSTAKLELKKSKRKDYYKILGVERSANEDEIKKAYRKRALVHHPGTLKSPAITCNIKANLGLLFRSSFGSNGRRKERTRTQIQGSWRSLQRPFRC